MEKHFQKVYVENDNDINKEINDIHVLLVDDEEFFVNLWRNILGKRGFKVTAYTDGRIALKEFKDDPYRFDVVVTDQFMPAINGIDLAKELIKIRGNIKIILCTGYIVDSVKDIGISELLLKPFDNNKLIEAIEKNVRIRKIVNGS